LARLRGALANLALLLGSIGVCLASAEVVLRALAPQERRNEGHLYRLEPNPGLARSALLPDASALHMGVRVRTNSFGLRDREYAREKPRGTLRVAFFGDSFTYGQGVELEDLFTERVEARLGGTLGEGRVEVWNFGTAGFNTFQELLYYAHYGQQFDPDLVVLVWVPFDHEQNGYTYKDFERFDQRGEVPPAREYRRGERVGGSGLGRLYRTYLQPLYVVRFFGRRAKELVGQLGVNLNRLEESEHRAAESEGHRLQFASLRKFHQLARASGDDFLLVLFPGLQRLDSDYYQDLLYAKLEAFCAEHGIPVLNLFPSFRGRDPAELHVSLVDAHPNAKAHALAADALFDALYPRLAPRAAGPRAPR
jgi:lysophospholipase L1-like esterase